MNRIHFGSTVVAVRTNEEVFVGADSRTVSSEGVAGPPAVKIFQSDQLFFSVTGLMSDVRGHLNVAEAVREGRRMTAGRPLLESVSIAETLISEQLRLVIPTVDPGAPLMAQFLAGAVVSTVFFGFDDDYPQAYQRFFLWRKQADGQHDVEVRAASCNGLQASPQVLTLGEQDEVNRLLDLGGAFRDGYAEGIERLIVAQATATPQMVGGPVDVLRIVRGGATWLKRKEECEDIQPF